MDKMVFLPKEIIQLIYEYDNTYHDEYKKTLKLIDKLPKFISYSERLRLKNVYKIDNCYLATHLNPINYYLNFFKIVNI